MRVTEADYAKLKRGEKVLPTEHESQVEFFTWWHRFAVRNKLPPSMCFAIPNGGQRHARTAGMLKAEGVTSGVSDIFLAIARDQFHGLFIEMKRPPNTVSVNQANFQTEAFQQGYLAVTCYSTEDAIREVRDYLGV